MSTLSRVASAVVAAAVTVAILIGVPIALWLLSSSLLDRGLPAGASIVDLLLAPDNGTLLIGFLTVVATGTWLVLAVSIVVELVAVLVDRPSPRIDLPGFRLGHAVAAALVTAMLGAGPALATPAVASPVLTATMAEPAFADPDRPVAQEATGPVHIVQRRDTLWRIAETSLGDPLRWREIYDLNADRIQDDGGRLTEASELVVGWHLVLPPDAQLAVRVEVGDTLSEIAGDHLGDPARSDELFAANLATRQPDGETLVDPDLIRPGWTLLLPDRAPPPADEAVLADEPVTTTAVPESERAPDPPSTDAPTSDPAQPATSADESPVGSPATQLDTVEQDQDPTLSVTALGVSALVAGGVLTSLVVRRRRQQRLRPARHRIPVPAGDDGRVEWSLSAPQALDGPVSAARHLDLALRSLTHPDLQTDHSPGPVLTSARLTSSDTLLATTTETQLPSPFTAAGPGGWGLGADDPLPVPVPEATGCCAPFPALVSIATDADRTLMIDLEQRGVLRIGGDRGRCDALLRHLAAELATSSTAEDVEVLLVGLGEELVALGPDRLTTASDLDTALTEIEHRASTTRDALDQWQVDTVVEGRLRGVAADSWLPTVLLAAPEPDDEQLARLDALAIETGRSATAVVVIDPSHVDLRIGADNLLHLPDIGDGPWEVAQLTENAGTHLAAILGPTTAPAVPVGAASSDEPWATDMNEDGTLDTRDGLSSCPLPDAEPPRTEMNADAGPTHPEEFTAESAAVRRLAVVDYQDPRLDDDLTAWHADGPPTMPRIAILGEPTVTAPGPDPTTRRTWFAEVLVYLSLHPAGVTAAKALTDLWPDGHRISPATLRHAFYGARKWAGRGYDGDGEAPFVSDMQHDNSYRLRGHLLDWDLFRRLRKRGQARHEAHHPGAITDYEAALNLVRDPVLSSLRPGGYAWLNNHDQRHDLQIPGFIVDAAHELVDIALDNGDTRTARWAAERARTVDIDVAFDRPLTDLMRIAHAEDNRSELELYAAVLLDARGFDVPEELAPESFVVLNELLPAGPRRPQT